MFGTIRRLSVTTTVDEICPEAENTLPRFDEIQKEEEMATLTQAIDNKETGGASIAKIDQKIEVTIFPVTDVDRTKEFYLKLGWRLDADFNFPSFRVVQVTPHGSACSLQFGTNLTPAAPGSGKGYIIVNDIEAARNALLAVGVPVSEFFHLGQNGPAPGLDPERCSYFSRASFSDPNGNSWILQEVTTRLPGRVEPGLTSFASASDLASALKRAALAHGQQEARIGQRDENWPTWYAEYMVREQTGEELPQ
jgi:catechol 2,3-dioxygenase-like lactoylglutathione lyase family enzyme